jgi:hypothetical protein
MLSLFILNNRENSLLTALAVLYIPVKKEYSPKESPF